MSKLKVVEIPVKKASLNMVRNPVRPWIGELIVTGDRLVFCTAAGRHPVVTFFAEREILMNLRDALNFVLETSSSSIGSSDSGTTSPAGS